MHELSMAESILDILTQRMPSGSVLVSADLRIGALQGIDTDSLCFGWQALLIAAGRPPAVLHIQRVPWRLRCGTCGNEWEPADAACQATSCPCGTLRAITIAGRELEIVACDVEDVFSTGEPMDCAGGHPTAELFVKSHDERNCI